MAAPWFGARPLGAVRGVTMGRVFFWGEGQPCARLPACWSIYRSVVTCGWFIQLLNLCLGTMANDEKKTLMMFFVILATEKSFVLFWIGKK